MGLGDPHDGGRTTSKITLETGCVVYYKARDCSAEAAFHEIDAFMGRFEGMQPRPPLKHPAFVLRDNYAWMEEIRARSPRGATSAAAASRRAGELLALLDMLQAVDCNAANVLASAGTLVPIDVETLLQPLLAWARATTPPPEDPATVLRAGLLPGVNGLGAASHGAGAWLRERECCAGFAAAYGVMSSQRAALVTSAPFARLLNSSVRVLVRATAAYAAMARTRRAPAGDPAPATIHALELRSLERGDIPRFTTRGANSRQLAEGDRAVSGCIAEDGSTRAMRWLDNSSSDDLEGRLAVVRATLTLALLRRREAVRQRTSRRVGGAG